MGEIVAAVATCHAPQLFTRPPDEKPEQLDQSIAAMRELGKVLDETRPDVVLVLGSDHLETFSLTCVPAFAVIAGNRAIAEFAGRRYDLPIHRDLADSILNGLVAADFDVAYSEDAVLGHTFAVPFEFVLEKREIPIVPFFTNVYLPPLPRPQRCAALGAEIARIVAARPERVAVVASGGMSHYPGTWKYPQPEFAFDHWLLGELRNGNTAALLDRTVEQLDEVGNTELLAWAAMLGAIGAQPAELIAYTDTWHHGHAMVRFLPSRIQAGSGKPGPPYPFKNSGFEFYKHPPAHAYKLNRLLFDVRHDGTLRRRVIADLKTVADEYGLNAAERDAARALVDVGQAAIVSDFTAPLVKAGAHPLQALMSLHVVFGEHRRIEREGKEREGKER